MQPPHFNDPPGGAPPRDFGATPGQPAPNNPSPGAQVTQPQANTPQPAGTPAGPAGQGWSQQAPQQGPQGWGQPTANAPQQNAPQQNAPHQNAPQQGAQGWGQPAGAAGQGAGWGAGQPGTGQPQGYPGMGQPGMGQPAGWGQPQAGWRGPGGPPMAGGYPQAGPVGFGAVARFQHMQRPIKTGPSTGIAIVKLGGGGCFLLILVLAMVASAFHGYGLALLFGVFIALCVWGVASGIADLMKKKLSWQVSLGIAAGAALLFTIIGPSISTAFAESEEKRIFSELSDAQESDYFDANRWKYDYANVVDERFQRAEWKTKFFLARIATAAREKDAASLRTIVKEIDQSNDKSELKEARSQAAKEFREFYGAAKEKLYAGSDSKTVDPALRDAFYKVLDDLSQATDSTIFVAFVNNVQLDAPKGDERILALYRAESDARSAFPKGAPVIEPGSAFSPRYDERRRSTFIKAMGESFSSVFDSNLVTLAPLEKGDSRKDKIVIEVSSSIYRIADYYKYNRTSSAGIKSFTGLLFAIEVSWAFKLYGRDGNVLYSPEPERSLPADQLRVSRGPNDPLWAMYSVMMDSAYYNYSRKVTGKFGLTPPPEKKAFTYQGG